LLLTSAALHDSQVAIPLDHAKRANPLPLDLIDAADAAATFAPSKPRGHGPPIDPNKSDRSTVMFHRDAVSLEIDNEGSQI
jgi:hypothetical protein